MAVSLPISLPASPGPARTSVTGGPSIDGGASAIGLPLSFVLVGLAALCTGVIWLILRPDLLATYHYNQYVISATHLFVLGWISSVVMGSMYQLVPVALETKLYSQKLARCQLALHCVGFIGMVWMFQTWNMKQVGHFGSVLALGMGLFAYNLARTLARVPKWNVTATAVAAALSWISLAGLSGLAIATAKSFNDTEALASSAAPVGPLIHGLRSVAVFVAHFDPISTMHAHAHLGALGCFVMLIVGVSYKLIPMFTLSEVQSRARAFCSVALLNAGLACCFLAVLLRSRWKLAFALLVIAGLALYGWEIAAILRARKRRTLDWGIKSFITAVALLLPLSILATILCWPGLPLNPFTGQLENLYGFLGFIGVITFAIIGMLYKIIPFLVWFKSYSRQIGRAQVPALADMYSARWQAVGYWCYLFGLTVSSAGIVGSSPIVIRCGCLMVALSLATLVINVGLMLRHLFYPRLTPLASRSSATLKIA
jgi:hypothetical protein